MSQALEALKNQDLSSIFGAPAVEQSSFAANVSTADYLPSISIRGKEFRPIIGGEEKPPIKSRELNVVLLTSRERLSKVYYAEGYSGEAGAKPDCASASGIKPDDSIQTPVHTSCQLCPNNAWGSKVTLKGKQGKACSDYRLIIFASAENRDVIFQMRVPAASLKPLATYAKTLGMMRLPIDGVVTKITFTDDDAPVLNFEYVTLAASTAAEYEAIQELKKRADVEQTLNSGAASVEAPVTHIAQQPVVVRDMALTPAPEVVPVPEAVEVTIPTENKPKTADELIALWGSKS